MWNPAPGVLVTQVTGVMTAGIGSSIAAASRRILTTDGHEVALHDWEDMVDYESESRVVLTELAREFKHLIEMNHILLRSRVVSLAVQAASLVVPNIKVHPTRATLDIAIREALRAGKK